MGSATRERPIFFLFAIPPPSDATDSGSAPSGTSQSWCTTWDQPTLNRLGIIFGGGAKPIASRLRES
jgi:hypothetical protein